MSSDTQQNETSFQVDNLTTDAPPIYTEAAHWSISGQALDTQRKHQQDPPPAYKSGQQAVDSVQQSGSLQQAG